jgi:serine/threonine protein kinase
METVASLFDADLWVQKYVHTGSFVEFFGWFEDIETMYIAMEYFPHGTLSDYIGQGISENGVRKITGQLLIGLALMHEHDYAHRDLKPDVSSAVLTPSYTYQQFLRISSSIHQARSGR